MNIRTRFAPSPTGLLHVGNIRTALVNKLFALKHQGEFILRIDDTDRARSTKEFEESIIYDLNWLGYEYSEIYWQSKRVEKYMEAIERLKKIGRLYECFETEEELNIKRKFQLSNGRPPIYDRAALKLTSKQRQDLTESGRKPHYRFRLDDSLVEWKDMIKGITHFDVTHISDPVILKEDGSMTYMLCSCVDDIDMKISHVIRGEDHVTNTAIHVQIIAALGAKSPEFGHLSLIKTKEEKISKRIGGGSVKELREQKNIEPMSINSFFANLGTHNKIAPYKNLSDLVKIFDIGKFGTSPTNYSETELEQLNHKYIMSLEFEEIEGRLNNANSKKFSKEFWNTIRTNVRSLKEAEDWWDICYNYAFARPEADDLIVLKKAIESIRDLEFNKDLWIVWTNKIKEKTGRVGKSLYMPLRRAITGLDHGPELSDLILLMGKEKIINRLEDSIKSLDN
ncbi:MAG: glutamate--tRNA ligase [Rickettsiaceae bacterium]|nr:glutamate--tRNA ligase [Rickettsiaceae bacterium]